MTQTQLNRQAQRRLAILRHAEEVSHNVAATCRYYGITRTTFYIWLRRYQEKGLAGLHELSRRPHSCPNATSSDVIGKVIHLRQNYHMGPAKISMYLKRYHDVDVSSSGVWRILKRLEMNRLPSSQRYKRHDKRWTRYEKQQPGHRVQIDVKFLEPLKGSRRRHYQFTAIDDCTRLRALKIYDRCNQKTAMQFVDYVLQKFPFRVEVIQTDNGSEFQQAFPLARARSRDPACLHQAQHAEAQRQGGTFPPNRRRGVLPAARRRCDRRREGLQREAEGVGGLLQLQSAPRRSGWPDALRETQAEDNGPRKRRPSVAHRFQWAAQDSNPVRRIKSPVLYPLS